MNQFNVDYLLDNMNLHMPAYSGHFDEVISKKLFNSILDKFHCEADLDDEAKWMFESGWLFLGDGVYKCGNYSLPRTDLGQEIASVLDSKHPMEKNKPYQFKQDYHSNYVREVLSELVIFNEASGAPVDIYVGSCGVKDMRIEKSEEDGLEKILFYVKKN